ADCLPVLLCNEAGTAVAAVHAGWRGLLDGVIEAALDCFPDPPSAIMAWLGPAIGPDAFEVGDEVRQAFLQKQPGSGEAFSAHGTGKWLADLYRLAAGRLKARGVTGIYGGGYCTFTDSERFFSYRRDGRTGRMASLVWLDRGDDR
ncbi:MAG: peptidoglycan editing factor PgeF, partial [Gammaproteobacteria bacterium]